MEKKFETGIKIEFEIEIFGDEIDSETEIGTET